MVCVACSVGVERLEIDSSSRCDILLCANYHPMTAGNRLANGDRFQHTQLHVIIQSCFHRIPPVEWNGYWCVIRNWLSIEVDHQFHGRAAHAGQDLMLTSVECARLVVLEEMLL